MGGGALCLCCNLHEKTPAPRGRELYAGSTRRAVPAFMRRQWRRGGPARFCAAPRQDGGRGGFYGKWPRYSAGGFLWEATLYQEKFALQNSGF